MKLASEFEDGWVVVNPTRDEATNIPVPQQTARVVSHNNLKVAETAALVSHFNLASHRGIILLKEGRKISNADNLD